MERTLDTPRHEPVINNFSIQVATVNGSGSQSANLALMHTIFQMGVPATTKNLFPSNISGLPTWFAIRISDAGYEARKAEIDFLIALNPQTAKEDARSVRSGGVLLADAALELKGLRNDIQVYEVPFLKLAEQVTSDFRIKKFLANMVYLGVVAHLLSLDFDEVRKAIHKQFKNKAKAAELNIQAAQIGLEYAAANLIKNDPFRVERRQKTQGKIIVDGNSAAALGAMFGGCTVACWYPITPSSSLVEHLSDYMQKYRIDPETGRATFAIVQTEDELSAIGMVVGAGWAGARAMTATSGPGTSLMSEFAGLSYFSEIPAVLWDIQRLGPSTGLPTRTSQGDILSNYFLSHGDTRHIMLIPATVKECFQFAQEAFNLAERFQTLVICMSDLDLGMNNWISEEFAYPESIPMDRGKVLSEKELEIAGTFSRYLDAEGDGIPFRTIPGNTHPLAPYFTRGSGHTTRAEYSERPEDYTSLVERIARKVGSARGSVPSPVIDEVHSSIGIIAYGSSHPAVIECRDQLRMEHNIKTDYLRIRALPPSPEVQRFMENHERIYVVEQNRDGQMRAILSIEFPESKNNLRSVLHYTGIPVDARFITNSILNQESGAAL